MILLILIYDNSMLEINARQKSAVNVWEFLRKTFS